jgi:hypothetical protein
MNTIAHRKPTYDELVEVIVDMVGQHCQQTGLGACGKNYELCSGALTANAEAMIALEVLGKISVVDNYGRMVLANWIGEAGK